MELNNSRKAALFDALGYTPHEGQIRIHNMVDDSEVTTVVCGRRFGKTMAAQFEAIYQALQEGDQVGPPIVYLVAPTYNHSSKLFDPIVRMFQTNPFLKQLKAKTYVRQQMLRLASGAEIWSKTGDNPPSLAGDSVSFAIIDEAGEVSDKAMDILRPALAARENPRRLNIGTPDRADTFFRDEFDWGNAEIDGYASLTLPSIINPFVSEKYLENEKRQHSASHYDKMYLAKFVELEGTPFASLLTDEIISVEEIEEPEAGRRYVAGVDLADRRDYTAVVIIDITEKPYRVVYVRRWNGLGYEATGKKVAEILRKFKAYSFADRTGVGDAAIPFITKHYGNVEPVVFTLKEKASMFDTIYTHLEKKELLMYNSRVLIDELKNLRAIQRSKGVSYEAPGGMHDDTAMALFLAGKGINRKVVIPTGLGLKGYRRSL